MILHCTFEEVQALKQGAEALLRDDGAASGRVAAPPVERAAVEWIARRLAGDVELHTLAEQRTLEPALEVIVESLRSEMDHAVLVAHAADEAAVAAYFDYAHALSVLDRVRAIGREMTALIELLTGETPTAEVAESFLFPD